MAGGRGSGVGACSYIGGALFDRTSDARTHTHTHTHVRIMGDAGPRNGGGAATSPYTSRRTAAVQAADAAAMVPINARSTRASKPPRRPPPKPNPEAAGEPVLQARAGLDADEAYGEQEKALSEFLRLHPMLNLEATSHRTLQLMGELIDEAAIPTRELEVVPKSHDDAHLRPPDLSLGERPCCLGERCICVWMARWRYGDHTDLAFVGTEFLLPSQRAAFEVEGVRALPPTPGKCLVCSRYMHVRRRLPNLARALGLRAGELPAHLMGARVARGGQGQP